jgi:hypothetical protein
MLSPVWQSFLWFSFSLYQWTVFAWLLASLLLITDNSILVASLLFICFRALPPLLYWHIINVMANWPPWQSEAFDSTHQTNIYHVLHSVIATWDSIDKKQVMVRQSPACLHKHFIQSVMVLIHYRLLLPTEGKQNVPAAWRLFDTWYMGSLDWNRKMSNWQSCSSLHEVCIRTWLYIGSCICHTKASPHWSNNSFQEFENDAESSIYILFSFKYVNKTES